LALSGFRRSRVEIVTESLQVSILADNPTVGVGIVRLEAQSFIEIGERFLIVSREKWKKPRSP